MTPDCCMHQKFLTEIHTILSAEYIHVNQNASLHDQTAPAGMGVAPAHPHTIP